MKVAVVGRGLIGSAAARHLAKAGQQVVLIGPDEVTGDWSAHGNSFASHYDEGRITRKNDRRAFFARASAAAIARYAEIAADSGIDFFTETGALLAGSPAFMARVAEARQDVDVSFEALDAEMLADRFPFFAVPDGFQATSKQQRQATSAPAVLWLHKPKRPFAMAQRSFPKRLPASKKAASSRPQQQSRPTR